MKTLTKTESEGSSTADIRLALQVDSSGALTSIKTFNAEVDKTPGKAKQADSALKSLASSFTSGLGIGVGIETFRKAFGSLESLTVGAAKALGAYSDQMVTLAARTGLTVASVQAFNHMAKMSGTDVGALSAAVVKMEVALGRGDDSFKKLGLSVSTLKSMAPDAAFSAVADSVGAIEDPMQRAAAAVAIFGKSGAEMLPLFTSNMSEARKQAEEFGLILSDKTMTAAEALGDAIETTGASFQAFMMRLVGVVAESPAVLDFFNGLSRFFGDLAPLIEKNKEVLLSFVRDAVDGAVESFGVLADAMLGALNILQMLRIAGQSGKMGLKGMVGMDLKGDQSEFSRMLGQWDSLEKLTLRVSANVDKFKSSMSSVAKLNFGDMGGLGVLKAGGMNGAGVLLPGGSKSGGGGGGGGFDNSKITKAIVDKVAELKVPNLPNLWWDLGAGSQGKHGTMQGGSKTYDFWGDKSKFRPPEVEGNVNFGAGGAAPAVARASFNTAQALQNLANIAQLSGSKLGKTLAGIAGGGAGLAGGLGSLFGTGGQKKTDFGTGITSILGKAGAYGQMAASALSIGSAIFGMFKKKKPEPPPEPPKKATAEAWRSFTGDQQSKGTAGILAGVSGIGVSNAADMGSQASIALQSYWQVWKDKGPMAAAAAFTPIRDKMLETFKAAGASDADISAMLGPMSQQIDLAGNKAFAGAAEGMNGFADALASVANQQMPMTIDQFRAYETQAVNGFNQMKQAAIDQGLSMEEATKTAAMASGKYLTTIKDASSKYGIGLGSSQALLDEASRAGVMLGSSSEERLIMSLDALTAALGGAPPKFEQAMTAGATAGAQAGGRISEGASSGAIGGASATDIGAAIAGKLTGTFDKLQASLSAAIGGSKELSFTLNMDGTAIANGIADVVDRGGGGRLQTALT